MQAKSGSTAQASFERAIAAMRDGDAVAAERICRRALEQHPRDGNLYSLLGAALIRQGKIPAAESQFHRAVDLLPVPVAANAHEGLGQSLLLQGNLDQALKSFETARRIEPGRASVLYSIGEIHTKRGSHAEAARIYRDLVVLQPNDIKALERLSGAAFRLKQYPEAEALTMRALALQPANYYGWMDLGLIQQQQDRLARAEHSFREAARLDPSRAAPLAALGTVLTVAGRHDEAATAFEAALRLNPTHAESLAGLGHVLKTIGQQARSIASYRTCIAHHPDDGEAYWSLAGMKTFRFDDHEIEAMRTQIATGALAHGQRTSMTFALATALDSRREFAEAFELFELANAAVRAHNVYDPDATRLAHDQIIQVFDRSLLETRAGCGVDDDGPIFIVGLPRSGSTLLEQILASHSAVQGTHELPELHRLARNIGRVRGDGLEYPLSVPALSGAELHALGSEYLAVTREFRGEKPRFTDKMPSNFRHVGLISLVLPNARIINARRHPLDTCLSCYKQLFAHGQHYSYDLRDLGLYYLEYERLMAHWRAVLPGRVLDVQYESVVMDPEAATRRVLEHCGLPWEDGCLRFHENPRAVRTASSEQVRQPLYTTGMQRWRDYEAQLAPLIEILQPLLRELPYELQPRSVQAASRV